MPYETPIFRLQAPLSSELARNAPSTLQAMVDRLEAVLKDRAAVPDLATLNQVVAQVNALADNVNNAPTCEVWRAGGTSLSFPAKARTLVPLQTVKQRSHGTMWSAATPAHVVAPKDGVYEVEAFIAWPQMGQTDPESVYIEYGAGSTVKGGRRGRSGAGASPFYNEMTNTVKLPLRANDWVRMYGENGATGAVTLPAENRAAGLNLTWIRPLPGEFTQD